VQEVSERELEGLMNKWERWLPSTTVFDQQPNMVVDGCAGINPIITSQI